MTSRQEWLADMIARLEPRAAALHAHGTRAGSTIAGCLDDLLARFRIELEDVYEGSNLGQVRRSIAASSSRGTRSGRIVRLILSDRYGIGRARQ